MTPLSIIYIINSLNIAKAVGIYKGPITFIHYFNLAELLIYIYHNIAVLLLLETLNTSSIDSLYIVFVLSSPRFY